MGSFIVAMFFAFLGLVCGGVVVFVLHEGKRKLVETQRRHQEEQKQWIQTTQRELVAERTNLQNYRTNLESYAAEQNAAREEFDRRVVSYSELANENSILKRDLRNLHILDNKRRLDLDEQQQSQQQLDERSRLLASQFLRDNVKWNSALLNAENFAACKQRLLNVIAKCRGIGFPISEAEERALLLDLKQEYERVVRAAFERAEQARIRAQIREEQVREREIERAIQLAERERAVIQAALTAALARASDIHSAEVEELRRQLAEAEERAKRAISQAQLTRAGHVYVISNIGSFGEGVFKIGMTRRLEPLERIQELSVASVPFPFDVHMMISADDAPTLETTLHREFHKHRINKTNPRKEFFRVDIESICKVVKEHHGEVQYIVDAEALQYRQSLTMSDEDQEFIEEVFQEIEENDPLIVE